MFGWGKKRSGVSPSGSPPFAGGAPGGAQEVDMQFVAEMRGAAEQSLRRTQEDVKRLAEDFKDYIFAREDLKERFLFMWDDPDAQQFVLLSVAAEVPRRLSPLEEEVEAEAAAAEAAAAAAAAGPAAAAAAAAAARRGAFLGPCIPWLGYVQKETKFAAVRLKLPGIYTLTQQQQQQQQQHQQQ
ncbi:hypothetical protein Efla_002939 [Eimeria flavescens]